VTLVETLVRCPSTSGNESKLARLLIAEMEARGFSARLDDVGNAVGVIGNGPRSIYLIGHMDTVSGDLPVRVKNGKLYGRGSVDAKGALAAFIEAAGAFKRSNELELTVVGCVEEEASSRGARHVMATLPRPDLVIIGEPSGWDAITLGYKGSLLLSFAVAKPRTHYGAPMSTAAEEAVAFYTGLCDAYPKRGTGFSDVAIRLISISSNQGSIHERAKLSLNVRTPPDFDAGVFRQIVERLAGAAAVEVGEHTPSVVSGKRNLLVRALLSGIRGQDGRPRFKYKTGTSDMNLLKRWECPIVAYGPGDSSLDHTNDEHLDLGEYELAIAVLTAVFSHIT